MDFRSRSELNGGSIVRRRRNSVRDGDTTGIGGRTSAVRWLCAAAVAVMSCAAHDVLAPGFVTGTWRGADWGLDADASPARLHFYCGTWANVQGQLRWSNDLTFEGTAEFPWNADPTGPDLVFTGRSLTPTMFELDFGAPGGTLDTLRRKPNARFPLVICE